MKSFELGKIYKLETSAEFVLPKENIIIWRDTVIPAFILISKADQVPFDWMKSLNIPLKIIGEGDTIKKNFQQFKLPPASRVITLSGEVLIQMNHPEKKLKFNGIRKKRVAIIDDSATMRKLLRQIISEIPNWEVVAEGEIAEKIPEIIEKSYPDIFTLDINLGKIDGAQAMKQFIAPQRVPTILVSSLPKDDGGLVMEALTYGAVDYIQKPEAGNWSQMKEELALKLESGLKSKWQVSSSISPKEERIKTSLDFDSEKFLLVFGSSTGGTQALQEILTKFPEKIPPTLITQHIPAGFSKALADRLNKLCPFEVKEAEDGDAIIPNRVLIAPGDHHMRVAKNGQKVEVISSDPVNRFRPSVEVLFKSVKENIKVQVVSVMLTGMGKDGAEAMCELRKKGAYTIAQNEESSVVFGMPKEVIRLGGACDVFSLSEMPEKIYRYFCSKKV